MVQLEYGMQNSILNDKNDESLITTLNQHEGPIRALSFNKLKQGVIASGGEDGNVFIWNLASPDKPICINVEGKNPHKGHLISNLSWNNLYYNILATTSHQGLTSIWDFKNKKSIAQFTNPNSREKRRYSSIAWNPENPTQLVVGVEDDSTPVIELWDLKRGYEPVKELKGHSKGVLSLSWCPDDSNLLISSGKDSQVLIWNPNIEKKSFRRNRRYKKLDA